MYTPPPADHHEGDDELHETDDDRVNDPRGEVAPPEETDAETPGDDPLLIINLNLFFDEVDDPWAYAPLYGPWAYPPFYGPPLPPYRHRGFGFWDLPEFPWRWVFGLLTTAVAILAIVTYWPSNNHGHSTPKALPAPASVHDRIVGYADLLAREHFNPVGHRICDYRHIANGDPTADFDITLSRDGTCGKVIDILVGHDQINRAVSPSYRRSTATFVPQQKYFNLRNPWDAEAWRGLKSSSLVDQLESNTRHVTIRLTPEDAAFWLGS